jgi:hypothetical protein
MSFEYIAQYYGLKLRRGQAVLALGKPGKVLSCTHHVKVRLDGEKHGDYYHPHDVVPVVPSVTGDPDG